MALPVGAHVRRGLPSALDEAGSGVGAVLARLGSFVVGTVALILYQSILWVPGPPLWVKLGFAAFAVLALVTPAHALLAVAGLTPLSMALWGLVGINPVRGAEALALAFIGAWYLRGDAVARPGERTDRVVAGASLLLGLIVAAACLQALTPGFVLWSGPESPAEGSARYFITAYLGPGGVEVAHACSFLMLGVALAYATTVLVRRHPTLSQSLVRMTVAGGVGAAALSLFRVALGLLRSTTPASLLEQLLTGQIRLSLHVADVNAAGSYFVLIVVMTVGLAFALRPAWPWLLAGLATLAALVISGSRSALVAGALVTFAGMAVLALPRGRSWGGRRGVAAGTLVLALGLFAIALPAATQRQVRASMQMRYYFTQTSLRMIESAPVFGVGVTRYISRSPEFMPQALRRTYWRENAHNNFLQVAAELGIAGGILFAVVVLVPFGRALSALRHQSAAPVLLGVVGGLAAFLLTCLSGHPLLHAQVAFPFWIVVGIASGLALEVRDSRPTVSTAASQRWSPVASWAAATLAVLVLISIPIRVLDAARQPILTDVGRGFHEWETDRQGRRFRWTTGWAMFYVPTGVRIVEIPLRAWALARSRPTTVQVEVNGKVTNLLTLVNTEWTTVRLKLPAAAPDRYWRVDLRVDPALRPAEVASELTDDRVLGVRVGEIQLMRDPENRADR